MKKGFSKIHQNIFNILSCSYNFDKCCLTVVKCVLHIYIYFEISFSQLGFNFHVYDPSCFFLPMTVDHFHYFIMSSPVICAGNVFFLFNSHLFPNISLPSILIYTPIFFSFSWCG